MKFTITMVTQTPLKLAVTLFGRPRICLETGDAAVKLARSTWLVLAYLALHRGSALRRDDVAFAIWPDDSEAEARANLRRHVHLLSRALPGGAEAWIRADTRFVAWNAAAEVELDLARFDVEIADPMLRLRALDRYEGDLMLGAEAAWLEPHRERYRDAFCAAARDEANRAFDERRFADAERLARRVLEVDPWREDVLRTIVAARARGGDRASALEIYRVFAARLEEELGTSPMPETRAFYDEIADDVAIELEPEPGRTLPAYLSSFVGRERELANLADALEASRLVTLLGPGGVGKSRLASRQASRGESENLPAIFVELASVPADRIAFENKIRDAFGARSNDDGATTTIARVIGDRPYLLVLDNLEHLTDLAAPFLAEIVRSCSNLRVLVTSRRAIGMPGEQIVMLRPLEAPSVDADPAAAAGTEAVRLFLDRARSVDAGATFEATQLRSIVSICRRLDGIPLAIELAAARTNLLLPSEIDARLHDRFALLTSRRRDGNEHHRTLRGTLDWSYELLAENERLAFRALSVFAGGWTLAAASEMVATLGSPGDDALDLIARLIDQSLVLALATSGSQRRYAFLETIRSYASLRLAEAGELAVARRVANDHVARYVAAQAAHVGTREETAAFDALADEHENIMDVIDALVAAGENDVAADLCVRLVPFWVVRGFAREARTRVERLRASERPFEADTRRKLANVASLLHFRCGDGVATLACATEALGTTAATSDDTISADALVGQARSWFSSNAYADVESALVRALATYRRVDDRLEIARVCNFLGLVSQGPAQQAFHHESLRIYEEAGHLQGIATVNYHLGFHAYERGDYPEAIARGNRSLEVWHESRNVQGENWARYNIACAEIALGSADRSAARFLACVETAHRYGFRRDLCDALERLAARMIDIDPTLAVRALGFAARERETSGHERPPVERAGYLESTAAAEAKLGAAAFDAAWSVGRTHDQRLLVEELERVIRPR